MAQSEGGITKTFKHQSEHFFKSHVLPQPAVHQRPPGFRWTGPLKEEEVIETQGVQVKCVPRHISLHW